MDTPHSAVSAPHADQLGLFVFRADDPNVKWMERFLREHGRWWTAAEILRYMRREETEDGKRMLRALASASGWVVSGQKGYKHLEHATAEEVNRFCVTLEGEAKKMGDRAGRIRRAAHQIFG